MSQLYDLWCEYVKDTEWSTLNEDVREELNHIETLIPKPRIPDDHLIFRLFKVIDTPSEQIKVVLLGQDPYPEYLADQEKTRACGFAFSSPLGKQLPFSLRIMLSEILAGTGEKAKDFSGDLSYLIPQGVFLLNTYLTIEQDPKTLSGKPRSHISWICFTVKVLNFIRRKCPKAVYLALGKSAADILKAAQVNPNSILNVDHPASARFGGKNPFIGSKIFAKANLMLKKNFGDDEDVEIDWTPMKTPIDVDY